MAKIGTKTNTKTQNEFSKFLVGYRLIHNMSQRDLGEMLGLPASNIGIVEAGNVDLPISLFAKLFKHLSKPEQQRVKEIFQEAINKTLES
ncbi:MAG: hypothetical protein ACK41T_03735 [Pseudobdellovibrio sp.]